MKFQISRSIPNKIFGGGTNTQKIDARLRDFKRKEPVLMTLRYSERIWGTSKRKRRNGLQSPYLPIFLNVLDALDLQIIQLGLISGRGAGDYTRK